MIYPSEDVRLHRLRRGIGASALSRIAAAVTPLVAIPIALFHLGATAYGAWAAALALTGFAAFADLGLGAGLMTRLAGALTDGKPDEARQLVSSAYVALSAAVATMIAALWLSSIWVDYGALLAGGPQPREITNIVLVTLTVFLVNIVAALIVRIQYAAQQIAWSNIWLAAGSVSGVGATVLAAVVSAQAPVFIAIASGVPVLGAAANSLHFFTKGPGRHYRPAAHAFRKATASSLLRLGSKFLIINVLIAATTTTDSIIVSNTAGLAAVPDYAIPARVFSVLAVATSALSAPLWPISVEAMRSGDREWVTRTTKRMAQITGATSLTLGALGVAVGPSVISLWLGGAVVPSTALLIGLAASHLVQSVTSPYYMVQNSAAVLAPQILGYALFTTTIPIKWLVSSWAGSDYIPYVTAAGFIVFLWPAVYRGYKTATAKSYSRSIS